jgi:hypothetical protein
MSSRSLLQKVEDTILTSIVWNPNVESLVWNGEYDRIRKSYGNPNCLFNCRTLIKLQLNNTTMKIVDIFQLLEHIPSLRDCNFRVKLQNATSSNLLTDQPWETKSKLVALEKLILDTDYFPRYEIIYWL